MVSGVCDLQEHEGKQNDGKKVGVGFESLLECFTLGYYPQEVHGRNGVLKIHKSMEDIDKRKEKNENHADLKQKDKAKEEKDKPNDNHLKDKAQKDKDLQKEKEKSQKEKDVNKEREKDKIEKDSSKVKEKDRESGLSMVGCDWMCFVWSLRTV